MSVSPAPPAAPVAFIGIDRCDQRLDICLQANDGGLETLALENTPEAMAQWLDALRQRFNGQPLSLCFEQPAPALLHQLAACDFVQIYAINPMTHPKGSRLNTAKPSPPAAPRTISAMRAA